MITTKESWVLLRVDPMENVVILTLQRSCRKYLANKAWSTSNSDTRRNILVVQARNNPTADEMREELAQMKTELGLVFKYVSIGEDKVNCELFY